MVVIHRKCGGAVGTYTDGVRRIQAKHFTRMDGTQPKSLERLSEVCPSCGGAITKFTHMRLAAGN